VNTVVTVGSDPALLYILHAHAFPLLCHGWQYSSSTLSFRHIADFCFNRKQWLLFLPIITRTEGGLAWPTPIHTWFNAKSMSDWSMCDIRSVLLL